MAGIREIAKSKAITINDERKKYSLDPIPSGDVVLISIFDSSQALDQKDCCYDG